MSLKTKCGIAVKRERPRQIAPSVNLWSKSKTNRVYYCISFFDFIEYENSEYDLIEKILIEKIKLLDDKNKNKVLEFIKLIEN